MKKTTKKTEKHPDAAEDKKLVKSMVKPEALKRVKK
jgi:hypothetical protein